MSPRRTASGLTAAILGSSVASERRAVRLAQFDAQIAMVDVLLAQLPAEPRFTTCQAENGETWTLAEMIEVNDEDEDLHTWLRAAQVGDEYRDIVTVTRVS